MRGERDDAVTQTPASAKLIGLQQIGLAPDHFTASTAAIRLKVIPLTTDTRGSKRYR